MSGAGPAVAIAIIGAGPAGLFAADALIRRLPGARIDVIERLPTPFGLVRGGVAPDHQGTKNIARQFERILMRPEMRFLGGVEAGRDVSYDELKAFYDILVIAVGAPIDRRLGIPGEDLPGVYGSGAFVGWYNGHPDHAGLSPRLDGGGVAVIGNGNVALDVARVLAKSPQEMAASDLCGHAARVLAAAPLTDIHVIGRRGPAEAAFSPAELAELGGLERAEPVVAAAEVAGAASDDRSRQKVIDLLRGYAARPPAGRPIRIRFRFFAAPRAVLGGERVEGLRLERTRLENGAAVGTGTFIDLPVCAVVSAIGYRVAGFAGLPVDPATGGLRNDEGRIEPGVYAVGWSRRGAVGTIPANRADAAAVADRLAAEIVPRGRPGGAALDRLLAARGVRPVTFADWQRIAAAEAARAAPGRPREKFVDLASMLAVLDRGS